MKTKDLKVEQASLAAEKDKLMKEEISKVEKVDININKENTRKDKCSTHCISSHDWESGHHDNREPLY